MDDWKQTFGEITAVAEQAFGIITQLSNNAYAIQFSNLEKEKNIALLFAGESITARENIEAQYEEKRKAIEAKQAKDQKAQAMFSIAINTAQAVMATLGDGGFFATPLAIAVAAMGAAQLAIVAATPVPAFWQGGEVGSSQQIMVNDDPYGKKGANYKEVIEKPNGQILKPQGKNVKMTVPKGSFVHPTYDAFMNSLDTELMGNNIMPIGQSSVAPMIINNGLTKGEIMEVMDAHANKLVNTINGRNGLELNIDENGFHKYVTRQGNKSKIVNSRFKGTGRNV